MKKQLEQLISEMVEHGILFDQAREEFEKRYLEAALSRARGNQTRAAQMLGIHRNTLNRKVILHKLNPRS